MVRDSLFINTYCRFTELLSTNLLIQSRWSELEGAWDHLESLVPKAVMKMRGLNLEKTWVSFGGGTHALALLLYSPSFMSPAAASKLCKGFSDI